MPVWLSTYRLGSVFDPHQENPNLLVATESCIFLVSYSGEIPWWPIQSLNTGGKKQAKA